MNKAQAFTLEGVMAALLLLLVMYTFFQSSLVISPMWSELTDAQLRLLANDALKILDNNTKVENKGGIQIPQRQPSGNDCVPWK